jgi:hypothetical protein
MRLMGQFRPEGKLATWRSQRSALFARGPAPVPRIGLELQHETKADAVGSKASETRKGALAVALARM